MNRDIASSITAHRPPIGVREGGGRGGNRHGEGGSDRDR